MIIDRNVIVASMSDDPETICECVAEFVPCARADVAAIAAAVTAGDAETIWQMSHRLKGGAALFGAHELKRTCGELESAANSSDWRTIRELAPKLASFLAEVEQAIGLFVEDLRAT
jgi:HPt (histidine-containing phosphotransfer) domain-containing protein